MPTILCKGPPWDSTMGHPSVWGHCGLGTLGERNLSGAIPPLPVLFLTCWVCALSAG